MAKQSLPPGLEDHYGKIRIKIGRHYKETLDLSAGNQRDIKTADKLRRTIQARLRVGLPAREQSEEVEFLEFCEETWNEYLASLDRKLDTIADYRRQLRRHWLPHFKGRMLGSITKRDVKNALSAMTAGPKGKSNYLIPLRGLMDHYEIRPNPTEGIQLGNAQKNRVDRYDNTERTKLVLSATGLDFVRAGDFQLLIVLLFGCGFRPGEALGLYGSDFNKADSIWRVSRQAKATMLDHELKTYVERDVRMPAWCRPYLDRYLKRLDDPKGPLFVNTQGKLIKWRNPLHDLWRALHVKAKVPIHKEGFEVREFYTCRHSRASELLSIGVSVGEAAEQLGNTPEMFQRIYARFIKEYTGKKDYSHLDGPGLVHGALTLVGDDD